MTHLFTELKIGSMTLKNRTFMAPMSLGYGNPSGIPDASQQEYWLARAKGGVGCIITDATSVDPNTPYLGNTLCFRSDESIVAYKQFTDRIHEYGCKIIPQITHPGPESISSFFGVTPISSSGYLNSMWQPTRALTLEEIPGIIQMYAKASYQAKQAGFDGIELHCAHGYMLLGSFLSPLKNKRTDEYGGSLENRARLLIEVIDAIKEKCGKEFPIILRMSGSEKIEGGNTIEDTKQLVPILIEHGIDAFEVSGGSQYDAPNKIIPSHGEPCAVNLNEALEIRKISSVPVILVGKINSSELAKSLIDENKVDGVVLGRALLAEPEFVNKIKQNKENEIAPCASCLVGCVLEQNKKHKGACVINPFAGKEAILKLTPATTKKKIMIVGGGMGGLNASRYAALRGFEVSLFEKTDTLGGQINLANKIEGKEEMGKWVPFLISECKRLNVDIHLNHEVTKEEIENSDYDTILISTGAYPVTQNNYPNAHDILSGKTIIDKGNVCIIGGGMVAVECAEYIDAHKQGDLSMTMIEMKKQIDQGEAPANYANTMRHIATIPLKPLTETKLISIDNGNVIVEKEGQQQTLSGFDHIVFAVGSRPENKLYEQVKDCGKEVYIFGDAKQVGTALDATRDGTAIVLSL